MNVAIFTTEYPPYTNIGGIATFMEALATLLAKEKHQVFVFTNTRESLLYPNTQKGITIIPFLDPMVFKSIRILLRVIPYKLIAFILRKYLPVTSKLIWYNFISLLTFISYQKHKEIKIIHTPVLFAPCYLLSLLFPDPISITHAQGPDELLQPYDSVTGDSRLKAWIEAQYMKRSNFIVSCSQSVTEYLRKKHQDVRKKLIYIPNFIDTGTFRVPETIPDTNTLLFIGRLENRKGPSLVAGAFLKLSQQYPKMKLIFLGEDTNAWTANGAQCLFSDYLKSFKMPISVRRRITFVPRIDKRSALVTYITTHQGIAVLPSRYEPFGFVYIEAMMAGCITVASKAGGGSEIIQNGIEGFTINPTVEDIVMCVHKIKSLQKQQLLSIIRHAKEKIRNKYDISCVSGAYRSLYNQMKIFNASSRS